MNVLRWPFRWIDNHYHHLIFRVSIRKQYEHFNLYALKSETAEIFFDTVIQSLELLKKIDFRRYIRAQKYIPNIAHVGLGTDHFRKTASAYFVDEFEANDIKRFAAGIVHEQ